MNALGVNMSGISKTTYIVACLSLSTSANMAEMMRAAYLSVNKGLLWHLGESFFRRR